MAKKEQTKRIIKLTDRVDVTLKDGSVISTHPENLKIYKEKGLISNPSKKDS